MTKVKDALNQEYVFTYDALGRELSQTRAGTTRSFHYDAVGNQTQRTDYTGRVTTYQYDVLNRLTNVNYVPSGVGTATFGYDDLSRLTSAVNSAGTVAFTYDNRDRVKTTTDVFGHVIEYSYDANGNRTQLILDGNIHTAYAYNNANLVTTLTDDASQNFTYAYDLANKLTSRTLPNGVTSTFDYDGMSRLTRLKHQSTTSTLVDNNFTHNAANQISQIAELAQTRNFTYDNVNRLTGMTNGTSNESYTYDVVGNRTASHLSATYSYQPYNRMTATTSASMTYNANGNLTQKTVSSTTSTYTWDYENRMTQASNASDTVHYAYDALGRRVERYTDVSLDDTKFTYDGLDVVMDDDLVAGVTKYQDGLGIDDKLSLKSGGVSKYFLADHLGSTVALTDATGAVTEQTSYDSFGNQSTNLSTRYQYTGREYDGFAQFYYYRARWYDGNVGRFVSEDPIGFGGGDVNLFGYVRNRPLKHRDPRGLDDADREWEDRFKPRGPNYNPWHYSHNEGADNPVEPNSNDVSIPKSPDWCGPAGSRFFSWLVPDTRGGFNFSGPCKSHDECYSDCGKSKETCDRNLKNDIEEVCKQSGSGCPGYGNAYYKGVTDYYQRKIGIPWHPGQEAYDSAQRQSGCPFCQPTPTPAPTPSWQKTGCWGGARGC
jgi:RHS repeat-associated protein